MPEESENLDPYIFESIIMKSANRKCYGVKTKNLMVLSD